MLGIRQAARVKHISADAFAALLGLHPNSMYHKLRSETPFTVSEALQLQESFFPKYTLRYLFSDVEGGKEVTL